ncbi:MAG: DEAD/DEAH box helicase [Pseudomonadota bacterium]
MPRTLFHPAVADWFHKHFDAPSAVQDAAWPAIRRGGHTLISAPTGSGKTLAAFLAAIDDLLRQGLDGGLDDTTRVLYVSPLKALSNDIQLNLQQPLMGIADSLLELGLPAVEIRAWVRTGDTPQHEREKMRRQPPHILVTTPESLYILLTSASGRDMLRGVRSVILDEIHALAGNKRGTHLALSLERLEALGSGGLQRIGISATQEPIETMAHFLVGNRDAECEIVNLGHTRELDLGLEIPPSPLEAVMAAEVWGEIYNRLQELAEQHRTTLIFVNTRRLAERVAHHLAERLGEDAVTAHHGSLSREHRLDAEQRLKSGRLMALVATASLELGIDIGNVDLVCQLGSPRNIAAFLQRVGRSGHALQATPKGRLFPLSRDDLVECAALIAAARRRRLDAISVPREPLDVLAQQIVAEVAGREWPQEELLTSFARAWPYRHLQRETYLEIVAMLADGFSTRRGRRGAYLHWDRINGRLRGRKGARLAALTNGGVIPDQFDYEVIMMPEGLRVGTLNEDFAFESLPGDIFQLGNTSYRILKVNSGQVLVQDARGEPPNIPFWFGEAPGRSDELSEAVSALRAGFETALETGASEGAVKWLQDHYALQPPAATQLVAYLGAAHAALGVIPTRERIVLERFFDEAGDMHLVVHSPYGSRLNRAWGLALRKRFCRTFNFELQAAALEDCIILSLGAVHSFPLEEVARYLNSRTARQVLTQALLDVPLFGTHWRWNATVALAVKRFRGGRKVPPQFQRSDAEDLVSLVFPDQLACLENIQGEREIPDHPLVQQTLEDCLTGVMDVAGLETLLERMAAGEVEVLSRDLAGPSPLTEEIIAARPYAFLDDAPAEERRTLAIHTRGLVSFDQAAQLARLDPAAVEQVRREAWPRMDSADELHDALMLCGFVTRAECPGAEDLITTLVSQNRIGGGQAPGGEALLCAAERLAELTLAVPGMQITDSAVPFPASIPAPTNRESALRELVRSRLECLGPVTAPQLAAPLGLAVSDIEQALLGLEGEGFVLRGLFDEKLAGEQWCERHLLARIHRYTVNSLRKEIAPVSPAAYMRFLFEWQGVSGPRAEGMEGTAAVLDRLAGFSVPAASWEEDILPARVAAYAPDLLDALTVSGRYSWLRIKAGGTSKGPVRASPVAILPRDQVSLWQSDAGTGREALSGKAKMLLEMLERRGALFFLDLVSDSGLLRTEVETALGELVTAGRVTADGFSGLRALIMPPARRPGFGRKHNPLDPIDTAGRWYRVGPDAPQQAAARFSETELESIAGTLIKRYGVVFRKVLEREANLPPWRDLLRTYWRLEARGEVRGGRFVEGFSGEQFAHPEAVAPLRRQREGKGSESLVVVCAADPLNLTGIITTGERVAAAPGSRVLYRAGVPAAAWAGKQLKELVPVAQNLHWQYRQLLSKGARPARTSRSMPTKLAPRRH